MLKETETEETIIGFFVTFLSLVTFQWKGPRTPLAHPLAPPGYAYAHMGVR